VPTWIHRTGKPVVVGVLNEKYEDEHVRLQPWPPSREPSFYAI
jgi:hypothetical protein